MTVISSLQIHSIWSVNVANVSIFLRSLILLNCGLKYSHFYAIAMQADSPRGPQIFQENHYFLNCLKRGCRLLHCLLLLLYSKYIISSAPDMDAIEPWRRDTIDV